MRLRKANAHLGNDTHKMICRECKRSTAEPSTVIALFHKIKLKRSKPLRNQALERLLIGIQHLDVKLPQSRCRQYLCVLLASRRCGYPLRSDTSRYRQEPRSLSAAYFRQAVAGIKAAFRQRRRQLGPP